MIREIDNLLELQHCACFNLRKTSRAITQYYDLQMKSLGLRGTQFTILAVLAEAGAISITHLADFLAMQSQLNQTLEMFLGTLQRSNQLRSFGVCHSCRHHQQTVQGDYFCALTQEKLSEEEIHHICREHEYKV